MKIISVGDIMPGGVLNCTDREYVSLGIKQLLATGNIRVGTLETAIGNEPTFYEEKMKRKADVIYAEDEDLKRLVDLNINIVSLANNHFFDLGPEGANHTIQLLDKLGIKHCGAGRNLQEASMPVVETINGKTIAFLAFCDWRDETTGWCPFATETDAGVNPMYDNHVVAEIKKYSTLYDYIVVIPHWGIEYDNKPSVNVYKMSKKMLKSGADLILGGHTHCVQPIINRGGKSIVYSMGNFLFPDRLICPPRSTYYPHPLLDISKLPVTDGYPYVEEITFKKWNPTGRIGMIVTTIISDDKFESSNVYTKLTEDNMIVETVCPRNIEYKLFVIKILLISGCYAFIRECIRTIKSIIRNK